MVDPDEDKRPDFRTLKSKMPQYSEIQEYLRNNQGNRTNIVDVSD